MKERKMKKRFMALFLMAALSLNPIQSVAYVGAAAIGGSSTATVQPAASTASTSVKVGWVKTKAGYRWRLKDGTYLKSSGWVTLKGRVYYLKKGIRRTGLISVKGKKYYLDPYKKSGRRIINGATYYFDKKTGAACTGWQVVKEKKRFFLKNGKMAQTRWIKLNGKYYYIRKNGTPAPASTWLTVDGKRYYIGKKGYRATGLRTISGKQYFFDRKGVLVKNQESYTINGQTYEIDANGVAVKVDAMKIQCYQKARAFVEKHTNSGMSNQQKFRACFNYIIGYSNFKPWINPTNEDFQNGTWPYKSANYMFDNGLAGSCYGIASAVAACAKVLGYEPYVIATTGDHGFVMIDGCYYDNMGPLFGATTHTAYSVRSKIEF